MQGQPQTATPQTPAASAATAPSGPQLTIAQAEQMAIQHNPNISIARLLALVQGQVTRQVRSMEMPTAEGALTAVDAHDGSRITAGALSNPSIYNRAAGGLRRSPYTDKKQAGRRRRPEYTTSPDSCKHIRA